MTISIDAFTVAYAALVVAFVFAAMRGLYGSWPWEFDKSWHATRPIVRWYYSRKLTINNKEMHKVDAPAGDVVRGEVVAIPPLKLIDDDNKDTFERPATETPS